MKNSTFNLETNYVCKVFKNVPIFFSVLGKTLRLRHSRSGLVRVTSEPCEQSLSRDIPSLERCIPFTVYLYSFYTYVTCFTHFTQHLLCIYRARAEYFLIADDAVASEQQTYFRSLFLSLRKITSANRAAKRFPWRRNFLVNHGLALKIKRLLARSCAVDMFTSRNWKDDGACVQPPFFLRTTRWRKLICQHCAAYWWNRHQEDSYWRKWLEDIFYLFAYGVNDLSHLVVLIIFETINVLMIVDASCRLLLQGHPTRI